MLDLDLDVYGYILTASIKERRENIAVIRVISEITMIGTQVQKSALESDQFFMNMQIIKEDN
jgi:hypothetical protein